MNKKRNQRVDKETMRTERIGRIVQRKLNEVEYEQLINYILDKIKKSKQEAFKKGFTEGSEFMAKTLSPYIKKKEIKVEVNGKTFTLNELKKLKVDK